MLLLNADQALCSQGQRLVAAYLPSTVNGICPSTCTRQCRDVITRVRVSILDAEIECSCMQVSRDNDML